MPIDFDRVPANGLEAGDLVGRVGVGDLAVDGDIVVVPDDDKLVELEVTGQRDGFLGNTFHQAPIAGENPCVMVNNVGAEFSSQLGFSNGETDRIAEASTEWAGRGLNAGGMTIFGVASGLGSKLAEILDLLNGHVLVAQQIERGIEQH